MAFKYARSQEAYDRFSAATSLPLTLLAVLWLPTLVFPLVMNLPASVVRTFDLIDLVIWLLYGAEYLIRLYLFRRPAPASSPTTSLTSPWWCCRCSGRCGPSGCCGCSTCPGPPLSWSTR